MPTRTQEPAVKSRSEPLRAANAKRCWVCSYLLWMHPFTMYQRWFYSETQAKSYLDRQHGIMKMEIRHA